MSRCLSLVCDACKKSLWVGQEGRAVGWYVYGSEPSHVAMNRFVNEHYGHPVRFADCDSLGFDVDEVDYSPADDT